MMQIVSGRASVWSQDCVLSKPIYLALYKEEQQFLAKEGHSSITELVTVTSFLEVLQLQRFCAVQMRSRACESYRKIADEGFYAQDQTLSSCRQMCWKASTVDTEVLKQGSRGQWTQEGDQCVAQKATDEEEFSRAKADIPGKAHHHFHNER